MFELIIVPLQYIKYTKKMDIRWNFYAVILCWQWSRLSERPPTSHRLRRCRRGIFTSGIWERTLGDGWSYLTSSIWENVPRHPLSYKSWGICFISYFCNGKLNKRICLQSVNYNIFVFDRQQRCNCYSDIRCGFAHDSGVGNNSIKENFWNVMILIADFIEKFARLLRFPLSSRIYINLLL